MNIGFWIPACAGMTAEFLDVVVCRNVLRFGDVGAKNFSPYGVSLCV